MSLCAFRPLCARLYTGGQKLAEGATMAADASLPLERIAGALRAFFGMLSDPDTLPEFRAIQAKALLRRTPLAHPLAAVVAAHCALGNP